MKKKCSLRELSHGARLMRLHAHTGIDNKEIARRIGISETYYYRLKKDSGARLSPPRLLKLEGMERDAGIEPDPPPEISPEDLAMSLVSVMDKAIDWLMDYQKKKGLLADLIVLRLDAKSSPEDIQKADQLAEEIRRDRIIAERLKSLVHSETFQTIIKEAEKA